MAATLITHQHDTVDALCWRHYGRTAGVTEVVLQNNPGLADHGPVLPAGISVLLPSVQVTAPVRQQVHLWD